jgi:hypothetical protein
MASPDWWLAATIAVAALSTDTGIAASSGQPEVRVRIVVAEGSTTTADRYIAAMMAEADAIWRPHGVRVSDAASGDVAAEVVTLTVGIDGTTDAMTGSRARRVGDSAGLGAIWFSENGTPGDSIALSFQAISVRIRQAGIGGRSIASWPPALADGAIGRALGRVLAHEIGHYLLASPAHAPSGLMRATFDGRQLAAWDRRSFTLDRSALPRLRARLARLESARRPLVAATPPLP